jgi:hypothetical protein
MMRILGLDEDAFPCEGKLAAHILAPKLATNCRRFIIALLFFHSWLQALMQILICDHGFSPGTFQ